MKSARTANINGTVRNWRVSVNKCDDAIELLLRIARGTRRATEKVKIIRIMYFEIRHRKL